MTLKLQVDYVKCLRERKIGHPPFLMLAPMEMLADRPFRKSLQKTVYGFDEACTEFIRVPSKSTHTRNMASGLARRYDADELNTVPLGAQIMGSCPELLAIVAAQLAHVKGAPRVDLNCGCPADTVTGGGAGSSLLKTPELLHACVAAMVAAVAGSVPISVKLRAGFLDTTLFEENLLAAQEAGASFITLHPRTKAQCYSGRADWELIARAKSLLSIPVVGNGDVVSVAAARQLLQDTGCDGIMIGRGAVQDPLIFHRIRASFAEEAEQSYPYFESLFNSSLCTSTYGDVTVSASAPRTRRLNSLAAYTSTLNTSNPAGVAASASTLQASSLDSMAAYTSTLNISNHNKVTADVSHDSAESTNTLASHRGSANASNLSSIGASASRSHTNEPATAVSNNSSPYTSTSCASSVHSGVARASSSYTNNADMGIANTSRHYASTSYGSSLSSSLDETSSSYTSNLDSSVARSNTSCSNNCDSSVSYASNPRSEIASTSTQDHSMNERVVTSSSTLRSSSPDSRVNNASALYDSNLKSGVPSTTTLHSSSPGGEVSTSSLHHDAPGRPIANVSTLEAKGLFTSASILDNNGLAQSSLGEALSMLTRQTGRVTESTRPIDPVHSSSSNLADTSVCSSSQDRAEARVLRSFLRTYACEAFGPSFGQLSDLSEKAPGKETEAERSRLGRLKRVMRYLFTRSPALKAECDRLLRLQPAPNSAVALLEQMCSALDQHWVAGEMEQHMLLDHMTKQVQLVRS